MPIILKGIETELSEFTVLAQDHEGHIKGRALRLKTLPDVRLGERRPLMSGDTLVWDEYLHAWVNGITMPPDSRPEPVHDALDFPVVVEKWGHLAQSEFSLRELIKQVEAPISTMLTTEMYLDGYCLLYADCSASIVVSIQDLPIGKSIVVMINVLSAATVSFSDLGTIIPTIGKIETAGEYTVTILKFSDDFVRCNIAKYE